MDTWVDFDVQRRGLELVIVIVHFRSYMEQIVLRGSVSGAARAGRVLLDHPPLAASSRAALAWRFPQADEREAGAA
jgi:hypothetical protein